MWGWPKLPNSPRIYDLDINQSYNFETRRNAKSSLFEDVWDYNTCELRGWKNVI